MVSFFLVKSGYPFSGVKLWGGNDLGRLVFPIGVSLKIGISEVDRSCNLEKFHILQRMAEPSLSLSLNQVQSGPGSLQWVSQMCHWAGPFLASLYSYVINRKHFGGSGEITYYELSIFEIPHLGSSFSNGAVVCRPTHENRNLHGRAR